MKTILAIVCWVTLAIPPAKAVGECYTRFADDGLSCASDGRFRSPSLHDCCANANATGFADTSRWIIFPELFNRKVSCKACADTFNYTTKWCFAYQNSADATCLHIPKSSTLPAENERDCCLWLNARGYTETPFWQWSNSYGRWYTSCTTCYQDRFVACYSRFSEIADGDTFCMDPNPRLGLNPYECCRRPNVTGYSWMETINRRKCHPCPVDGGWSAWSPWSPCSATCGIGAQRRLRTCSSPAPKYGGSNCLGKDEDVGPCTVDPVCPVNETTTTHRSVIHHDPHGYWSQWSAVSQCSVTCGRGTFERRRKCLTQSNPRLLCTGNDSDSHPCQNPDCQMPDSTTTTETVRTSLNWTWSSWSPCHLSCGFGIRSRSQVCIPNPPGSEADPGNRTACPLDGTEVGVCEQPPCPVTSSEKYTSGATIAWSVAGVASAVLISVVVFLVCRKRRLCLNYSTYLPGRRPTSPKKGTRYGHGERGGELPPIPPCTPPQYSSVPDLTTTRYVLKPGVDPGSMGRLQDDEGYEIPRQCDDSDSPIVGGDSRFGSDSDATGNAPGSWASNLTINHVYEQLDFDSNAVTPNGRSEKTGIP